MKQIPKKIKRGNFEENYELLKSITDSTQLITSQKPSKSIKLSLKTSNQESTLPMLTSSYNTDGSRAIGLPNIEIKLSNSSLTPRRQI